LLLHWVEFLVNENEVAICDWVIVNFAMEQQRGRTRRFVGQVRGVRRGQFIGKFVRPIFTKKKTGYVFQYPAIPDICKFHYDQIVRKVHKPKKFGRGNLLFDFLSRDI
jgi:hypothetical protein